MLSFFKQSLETIAGIEIYPVISFIIFILFFAAVTAYVIFQRKEHFDRMSRMPLDEEQPSNQKKLIP